MADPLEKVTIRRYGDFGRAFTPDLERCRADVPEGGRSPLFHQCGKKATVFRECTVYGEEGKGLQNIGFCAVHDPLAVAKRESDRRAKYDAEAAAQSRAWDRQYTRPQEYVEALRLIEAGHDNPRTIARDALNKWEDL